MSTPITLRQLEIFLAVARAGHVTRASELLHLSQSAASMAVAQLERQLDTALFERHARRLTLTERGRLLVTEAESLLARVQELPVTLSGSSQVLRGELRLAASQTIGRYLLAAPGVAFAARHPQVQLRCRIGNTEQALALLLDHEVDVAYVEGPVSNSALEATAWRHDRLEIVVASRLQKTSSARLTPKRLRELPWIMREPGSGTRELLDHAVRNAGLAPLTPLQTFDDTEAIVQAVIAGHGAACLPRLAVEPALKARRIGILQAPFLSLDRQLWRVLRRSSRASSLLLAFETGVQAADG